jgi:hypothetical protein
MSLVFPPPNQTVVTDQARTHALVIGVGEYPHFRGGSLYDTQPAKRNLGLKQLTSPPISAKEFAHWLIVSLDNPVAPLGSVELLLAPSQSSYVPPNSPAVPVEAATFGNIETAFDRWFARCDQHAGNIAVFYFCGHGLERETMWLLASDCGAKRNRPWENAIDFNLTRRALQGNCQARAVYCFLDACRDAPLELSKDLAPFARPLKQPELSRGGVPDVTILKAAAIGEQAHAPAGDVSYFTKALIRCLDSLGAASPYDGRKWRVSSSSLALAVQKLMERTKVAGGLRGKCARSGESWESTIFHEMSGTPKVMTTISYIPVAALASAELSLTGTGGRPTCRRPPSTEPWDLEAEAGDYDVAAKFPSKGYPDRTRRITLAPPFLPCDL